MQSKKDVCRMIHTVVQRLLGCNAQLNVVNVM